MAQDVWKLVEDEPETQEKWKLVEGEKPKRSPWYVPNLGLIRPILAGAQTGAANLTKALVYYADQISKKLGIPQSDAARMIAHDLETYSKANREKGVGGLAGQIAAGIGQAGFDIPTIMALGPAGLPVHGAIMGGAQGGGLPGALTGAATGALTHGALEGMSGLTAPGRVATGAAFGAATTPGGVEERVAGAATMGGLGLMGGRPQRGPIDLRKPQDIAKAKAMAAAGVEPPPDLAAQGEAALGQPRGGSLIPGMALPKRIGPINLERLDIAEEPKKLIADVEDRLALVRAEAKKKGTWDATQERADAMGAAIDIGQPIGGKTVEEVLDLLKKDTAGLPETILAARAVLATSANQLSQLARETLANPTDEAMARLQLAYKQHGAIQAAVGAGSSQAGRALNIHKKTVGAKDLLVTKGAKLFLKTLGKDVLDQEGIEALAALDSSDPSGMLKYLAEKKPATFRQKAFELWMNAILSNPLTHMVNMTSNVGTALWRAAEGLGGAGVELVKHPFNPAARDITFGEAGYSAIGALRGLSDGLKIAWEKMRGGPGPEDITKLEIPTHAIKGKKGEIVRVPSKALGAEDAFFKTFIYSSKIYGEAFKAATREGLRGEARKARVGELVANPTEPMKAVAKQEALYLTFNNALGKLGSAFMKMRKEAPGLEFIVPFVRTPTNIAKFGIQRTALGIPSLLLEARKGELPKGELTRRGASIAVTTGTGILISKLVADGIITGSGPTDPRERAQKYAQGWQPRSIKIGNKYYGYGRIEPLSTILGLWTDFHDIRQRMTDLEANKIAGLIMTSMKNNLLDKTFMAGVMDLIKATEDTERFGANFVNRLSGSVVPAVVAGAARAIDPNIREARSVLDNIKARIPGVSLALPPRVGPFGEPSRRAGTPASRMFSPVPVSEEIVDPVYKELDRLGMRISRPTLTIHGEKATTEEQRRLIQVAMPEVKAEALKVILSPLYASLKTDEQKKKLLESRMNKMRAFQRKLFVMEATR